MLFDLFAAIKRHTDVKITGAVHVGAYAGEELQIYLDAGLKPNEIVMVEGNSVLFDRLVTNVAGMAIVSNAVIGRKDDEKRTFHLVYSDDRTNLGCSSLLPLGKHAELYPACKPAGEIEVTTITLDSLLFRIASDLQAKHFNLLTIDVQGAELEVLEGAAEFLKSAAVILTEFAVEPLYVGAVTLDKLDAFLYNDFVRVETYFALEKVWGDCLYIRRTLLTGKASHGQNLS